jgi:hypothetical protein
MNATNSAYLYILHCFGVFPLTVSHFRVRNQQTYPSHLLEPGASSTPQKITHIYLRVTKILWLDISNLFSISNHGCAADGYVPYPQKFAYVIPDATGWKICNDINAHAIAA